MGRGPLMAALAVLAFFAFWLGLTWLLLALM